MPSLELPVNDASHAGPPLGELPPSGSIEHSIPPSQKAAPDARAPDAGAGVANGHLGTPGKQPIANNAGGVGCSSYSLAKLSSPLPLSQFSDISGALPSSQVSVQALLNSMDQSFGSMSPRKSVQGDGTARDQDTRHRGPSASSRRSNGSESEEIPMVTNNEKGGKSSRKSRRKSNRSQSMSSCSSFEGEHAAISSSSGEKHPSRDRKVRSKK